MFAFAIDISNSSKTSSGIPLVTVSGGTISWSYPPQAMLLYPKNSLLMWGVY